jgi:hypothetical protein
MEPNTAAQLSVASLAIDGSVESRSAVLRSAGTALPTRATGPSGTTVVDHIEESDLIVRADSSGTATLWRGGSVGGQAETFASGGGQLFAVKGAVVDGRTLVFVGGQQTAAVWDVTEEPREVVDLGEDTVAYSASWARRCCSARSRAGSAARTSRPRTPLCGCQTSRSQPRWP